ncbi:MarR family transcriptional regulator [Hahella sp. CCB-MM4]|uniref:helix-turn-helix transcriptional regulator n=1 Tax=Hahella sp. (strain CCB-MM4) TaxID=1926491 RepID=UPI000BC958E9|nr:metalloregulator ArsR/SmtB family transcription factor [Hahella sp. CCB-MM4]OZG73177.1 MarR family transcriptional regulator [Hahella sp. CCB-MM4]
MSSQEDSAERILYLIKSRGPASAKELSSWLGMTTMGARQHIARLEQERLLYSREEKQPRGRPLAKWYLSEKAQARFPDSHANLTVDLIASTREVFGEEGLDKLIEVRNRKQLQSYLAILTPIKDAFQRLEKLAELRSAEGYMAKAKEVSDYYLLIENHCPICVAARQCQGLCRTELENFQHCFEGVATVERTDHIIEGARRCCYRVVPLS